MSFDLLEKSRWLGQPLGLVRLARGNLLELYTNADRPITIGAETYQPLAITRNAIRDSTERAKSVLILTLPIDAPCVDWWRPYPASTTIGVTWLAKHWGENELAVEWTGRVIGPKFTDRTLVLNCEPTRTSARSRGLVLRWQRGCPLALYSQGLGMCNVNKASYAVPGVVTVFSGTSLQAAAFASVPGGKSLAGGFLEWTRVDGEPEMRSIMAHSGDLIVLNYSTDSLGVGSAVTAYPGCPHNWDGCVGFSNTPNYGGALFLPNKSPFDGNPV